MKRILAVLLMLSLVLCLSACGNNTSRNDDYDDLEDDAYYESEETENSNETQQHTHYYDGATCTSPAKCSCGATQGSALGHRYSKATCTEAAKCSLCGETNGKALGHKYSLGKCTTCGQSDPNAIPDSVKSEILANFDQAIADLENSNKAYSESTKGGFLASEYRTMAITLAKRAATYTGIAHTYASSYPKATLSDGKYVVDGLSYVKQTIDLLATDPSDEAYIMVLDFAKEIRSKIK